MGQTWASQLAFGGDHPIYLLDVPPSGTASPTGSDSFDEMPEVHLDREVDGDLIPCCDLLGNQVTEIFAGLLKVVLVDKGPWDMLSFLPYFRKVAGNGDDAGVQVDDFDHDLRFRNVVDLGEEYLGSTEFCCPLIEELLRVR